MKNGFVKNIAKDKEKFENMKIFTLNNLFGKIYCFEFETLF